MKTQLVCAQCYTVHSVDCSQDDSKRCHHKSPIKIMKLCETPPIVAESIHALARFVCVLECLFFFSGLLFQVKTVKN